MSRISDALARAEHPQTVGRTVDVAVPWDFADLPLATQQVVDDPAIESLAPEASLPVESRPVESSPVRPSSASVLDQPAPGLAPAPFSLDASAYVEKLILSHGVNPGFVEQFRRLGGV